MLDEFQHDVIMCGNKRKKNHTYLVNCFIGDDDKANYNNHIFLLYEYSGEKWYADFVDYLITSKYYLDMYEPDVRHTMFVFNVPKQWQKEYELFKEGKYSSFSEDYKERILSFYRKTPDSAIYKVLYKEEEKYIEWEKKTGVKIPRDLDPSSAPYFDLGPTFKPGQVPVEVFKDWMKYKPRHMQANTEFLNQEPIKPDYMQDTREGTEE